MKFTGERAIVSQMSVVIEKEHLDRYYYLKEYVNGKRVLDVACGSGYGSEIIANYGCSLYLGIDVSEEAIKYARKHYKRDNVNFICENGIDLRSVGDNEFDVVVSYETIEHIKRYDLFLKELKRVTKPNGTIIISTPNKKYSSPNKIQPINKYHVIEFYFNDFYSLLGKYFSNIILKGQDFQSKPKFLKGLIIRLFPKKIRQSLIPKKIRSAYNLNQVSYINDRPENSKYLIAICKR